MDSQFWTRIRIIPLSYTLVSKQRIRWVLILQKNCSETKIPSFIIEDISQILNRNAKSQLAITPSRLSKTATHGWVSSSWLRRSRYRSRRSRRRSTAAACTCHCRSRCWSPCSLKWDRYVFHEKCRISSCTLTFLKSVSKFGLFMKLCWAYARHFVQILYIYIC